MAPEVIDELVAQLVAQFKNTMTIKLSRPLGNPALLHITLARTLKAYVILRGEGEVIISTHENGLSYFTCLRAGYVRF